MGEGGRVRQREGGQGCNKTTRLNLSGLPPSSVPTNQNEKKNVLDSKIEYALPPSFLSKCFLHDVTAATTGWVLALCGGDGRGREGGPEGEGAKNPIKLGVVPDKVRHRQGQWSHPALLRGSGLG